MSLGVCWLFECAVQWCHWGVLTVWMYCSVMSLGGCCLNVLFSDVTGWGADCLNVLFSDITGGVLTVWMCCSVMSLGGADWMCCSVMSLGCWLFECDVKWCHWCADFLNVMLKDVTAGSDDHISLGVMTVHVTLRFFPKTTSQIFSLMWCVGVCVCVTTHNFLRSSLTSIIFVSRLCK